MGEAGLDAVAGVVGQRQRDGAGGCDRAVMGKTCAHTRQFIDQVWGFFCDALHVTAVLGMQHLARDIVAYLPAVARHFGALAQHLFRHRERFFHDRRRAFFYRQLQRRLPAGQGQFFGDPFGELHRFFGAVLHA